MRVTINCSRDEIVIAMKAVRALDHGVMPDEISSCWARKIIRRVGSAYRNELHVTRVLRRQLRKAGRAR